ncbi:hypothetical protein E8E12_008663 [Didymella heteroderae]|uniref:Extracellular membrane protein CFEM domain-containing protein n=1 Tax=Didymella heteroderae TaxID=1769908 RepID=A0A9P4WR22_9PLEO|nr:hypothetical protein E8E12_008663 [Didymella heteroderae]
MANGCGDGSKTTSYNCFCHTSSSYFSSLIGSKVESACATDNPDLQRTSAVDLFETYCHLGDSLTSVVSSTPSPSSPTSAPVPATSSADSSSTLMSSSASASPASTPHMVIASASPTPPTSTADPAEDADPPKKTNTTAIAVGVSVPISLIALATAVFLILRKKHKSPHVAAAADFDTQEKGNSVVVKVHEAHSMSSGYTGQSDVYELLQDTNPQRPVEIGSVPIHEMHQPVSELPARYSRS